MIAFSIQSKVARIAVKIQAGFNSPFTVPPAA